MPDDLTDRCQDCNRIAHFSPLTDGTCEHCKPNPDRELCKLIADKFDKKEFTFSTLEYRRAFRHLWITLNPDIYKLNEKEP